MWSTKKFIIIMVAAAVLAIVSVGGVVLAQGNGDGDETQPEAQNVTLLERVCEIYQDNTGTAINADDLQTALTQAQSEMQAAALEARLAKMVENGVIDEAQAKEFQDWWQSRPEDLPFCPGLGGHGMQRGFGGPGGFEPPQLPEGFEPPQLPE
jgi:hypothetical protein